MTAEVPQLTAAAACNGAGESTESPSETVERFGSEAVFVPRKLGITSEDDDGCLILGEWIDTHWKAHSKKVRQQKERRMIKNRESAARLRERKQRLQILRCREFRQDQLTEYPGIVFSDIALTHVEKEKSSSFIKAWEESEKQKVDNKAQKKLAVVPSWENTKKAAVEA
ncbi:hypothetical protein Vadar_031282 [Vaccinium darrowii]|uniref:Uncharacterized protein n=1 Tax=Vaccinium darrowii TaxID=229202 RepID=A0ACB7ZGP4_9ERIC|nr:hypothetical protein Vadar_031282 [Vaccinium darrowii]